ncbi:hypothetical protein OH491_16325 [Termitidicoccus mucosus]|uniref:Heparin-sulfate lyase N-terminal domain-containing protein n=1 Tax=Termitidicoccus mucosus TaxID=1184151 RepID=A0A178II48_9BACT|nr:hypothetical protein AW736_12225 [Opitutaceae bacterium TSB47]
MLIKTNTLSLFLLAAAALALAPVAAHAADEPALENEYKKTQLRFFLENAALAAEENTQEKTAEAVARLRILAREYRDAPAPDVADSNTFSPHSRRNPRALARHDFFVWRFLFSAAETLAARGELPADVRTGIEPVARENVRPRERAPNNRSFHFALGAIYAAKLFPAAPEAAVWKAYANAVFDDWLTLGDAYEPGYVEPWFPPLLELGLALGREADLRGPVARAMYARLRDHVSASGLAWTPGDPGDGADQSAYIEGLARAAEITGDGSLLGAAQRALRATPSSRKGFARLERFVKHATEKLAAAGVSPSPARPLAEIQPLFAATGHPAPDRLLLSSPDAPARPYAGFYAMDRTETHHHGHEDTRGEVYHYEADGVMLLRRPGWIKWAGCANTFVVADETAQFPFATTRGLTPGRWLAGSAQITPIRDIVDTAAWKRLGGEPAEYTQQAMSDVARGLGYSWINMSSYTGAHDTVELRKIVLRFLAIPEKEMLEAEAAGSHSLGTLSFDPGMAWYREYRPVAPAGPDGTLEFVVSDFRLAGMDGSRMIADFNTLPEDMTVVHYAPGTRGKPGRVVPRSEWEKWLTLVPDTRPGVCNLIGRKTAATAPRNVLRVVCPPGRLDLVFAPRPEPVDIAKTFPRVELDYQVRTPDATLLRLPIALEINDLHPRSIYLDGQQGGHLVASAAAQKDGDSFGALTYENVYAAGALWTRRIVLTREGIMLVVDEYTADKHQGRMAGGPVWQLAAPPVSGLNWFSAPSETDPEKSLLVWFHPEAGVEYGAQFQPKLMGEQNYAVFAKGLLPPGGVRRFVTVLVPHDTAVSPAEITGLKNRNMRLLDVPPSRAGVQTEVSPDGAVSARIAPRVKDWPHGQILIKVSPDNAAWSVSRKKK